VEGGGRSRSEDRAQGRRRRRRMRQEEGKCGIEESVTLKDARDSKTIRDLHILKAGNLRGRRRRRWWWWWWWWWRRGGESFWPRQEILTEPPNVEQYN
jgi:hypothetical protein